MNTTNKAKKTICILRWTTRILGILIALLFIVFFLGETDFSQPPRVTTAETFMILCIPIMLLIGILVAWKREVMGGMIIVMSILLFNIVAMISEGFSFELEFGVFLSVGLLFIICGVADRRLEN